MTSAIAIPALLPQPDRHLACAISTSPYGESGGSLFAWETRIACQRAGIPTILATFDRHHRYPAMSTAPRRLHVPGHKRFFGGEELHRIVAEARRTGNILILDVKRNFGDDPNIKQTLLESGITTHSAIAALVPLMPGQPNTWAAGLGVDAFQETGIYFDHGLFRYWDPEPDLVPPDFPDLQGFPFWTAATLSRHALSLIHTRDFSFEQKTGALTQTGHVGPRHQRQAADPWVIREVQRHLSQAATIIQRAVLEPLLLSLN